MTQETTHLELRRCTCARAHTHIYTWQAQLSRIKNALSGETFQSEDQLRTRNQALFDEGKRSSVLQKEIHIQATLYRPRGRRHMTNWHFVSSFILSTVFLARSKHPHFICTSIEVSMIECDNFTPSNSSQIEFTNRPGCSCFMPLTGEIQFRRRIRALLLAKDSPLNEN